MAFQLTSALEQRTRFIQPFGFDRNKFAQVRSALCGTALLGRTPAWAPAQPHSYYEDELLPPAAQFLFGGGSGEASPQLHSKGCHYFQLENDVRNKLFANTVVELNGESHAIRLVSGAAVELFLSPLGVGFLSLALAPSANPALTRDLMLDFNYRLSLTGSKAVVLHNAHPREDATNWERIPQEHRDKIAPPPALDAPPSERIGRAGGTFRMLEVVDLLLESIRPHGLRYVQHGLGVFTVVRFDAQSDLASDEVRREVGPLLSGLAQVEERNHAGALPDQLNVPAQILNRRHWTASSTYGTAHVVVDQPSSSAGEVEFNNERVPRVFNKYFVTFAASLLQRLIVQQTSERAARLVDRPLHEYGAELQELRRELLEFSIAGAFEPLSMRHAVQRAFHVVQQGMESQVIGTQVRHAIAELDAKLANDQRQELAERTAKSLEVAVETQQNSLKTQKAALRTQHIAEQVEIIILAVYGAELWHILTYNSAHANDSSHGSKQGWFEMLRETVHGFDHGALVFAALGALIGFLLVYRPWSRGSDEHH